MVKHARFYRMQLYNYPLGRLVLDVREIKPGESWRISISGEPERVQWRFWWINDGDESITSRIHWTYREKFYDKPWSDWGLKIYDVTVPLDPGVDAELTQDDYLPMKVYEPTGQLVWQFYEMLVQLYADDVLMDQLRIFIDNDALTLTVTSEPQVFLVETSLILNPMVAVAPGQNYSYTGRLVRADTGEGLPNELVHCERQEAGVWVEVEGSPVRTGADGSYALSTPAPEVPGSYLCRARYLGTPRYASSSSLQLLNVGAFPVTAPIALATGIILTSLEALL